MTKLITHPLTWVGLAVALVFLVLFAGTLPQPVPGPTLPDRADRALTAEIQAADVEITLPVDVGPSFQATDDPVRDGWDTEVSAGKAGDVLKKLANLLTDTDDLDETKVARLLTADFSCESLVPRLETAFQDTVLHVQRGILEPAADERPTAAHQGPAGFVEALRALIAPLEGATDIHGKFKLFGIQSSSEGLTTRQFLALSGRTQSGMFEENATWSIRWKMASPDKPPKIAWIGVEEFEQVVSRQQSGPLFVDCTESALGQNESFQRQFMLGMNHWFRSIQDTRYLTPLGHPGLAVGDVNGDGLPDMYVCQEAGLPNRLFLQNQDGTMQDVSDEWGVNWLENSRSALLVDLDNDGDQDLAVATLGNLVVAANEGGKYAIQVVLPTNEDVMSLTAVDYDNDADLDLYACVYYQNDVLGRPRARLLSGVAGTDPEGNNSAGRNSLHRNDISVEAGWEFTETTRDVGLDEDNQRHSFAAAWEDFDNDGDLDLYVANDFGRNNLYRNDGGKFTDITTLAGAGDSAFGMSVTWGDFDQDGWMDLYISNMFSAAGSRVTYQDRFAADASPALKAQLQRFARGNTLLRNMGDGTFDDVSVDAAVTMGRWSWSSNFIDINNDSWEDLVVANGFITGGDSGDL